MWGPSTHSAEFWEAPKLGCREAYSWSGHPCGLQTCGSVLGFPSATWTPGTVASWPGHGFPDGSLCFRLARPRAGMEADISASCACPVRELLSASLWAPHSHSPRRAPRPVTVEAAELGALSGACDKSWDPELPAQLCQGPCCGAGPRPSGRMWGAWPHQRAAGPVWKAAQWPGAGLAWKCGPRSH